MAEGGLVNLSTIVAGAAVLLSCVSVLADRPRTVAELPLDKCTPETALMSAHFEAASRSADVAPRLHANMKEVRAILDRYPDHAQDKQQIMDFLSPADNFHMAEVLAASAQLNAYEFIQSLAERDAGLMMTMLQHARDARDGKADLMKRAIQTLKADEAGQPRTGGEDEAAVVYVMLLRHMFPDGPELPTPVSTTVCSIDLALALEADRAFSALNTMIDRDPDFLELMRLRKKYQVPEGKQVDFSVMPAAERRYATELQSAVYTRLQRATDYYSDVSNLRRLAAISRVRYEDAREDLLQVGGARDKDALAAMDAASRARYKLLSPESQKMWNLRDRIDREVPSMQEVMAKIGSHNEATR